MTAELDIIHRPSTDIVDGTRFVTSINMDTPDGALDAFNALSDADDLRDHLGEVLEVVDFAAEPTEIEDDNGVVSNAIRTVLITKGGACL